MDFDGRRCDDADGHVNDDWSKCLACLANQYSVIPEGLKFCFGELHRSPASHSGFAQYIVMFTWYLSFLYCFKGTR